MRGRRLAQAHLAPLPDAVMHSLTLTRSAERGCVEELGDVANAGRTRPNRVLEGTGSRSMADEITLRPVTADDLDVFEREFNGPEGAGPYQWFGFGSPAGLRRRFAETGLLSADGGVLCVAEAGRTVGRVEWFASTWGRAGHLHLLDPRDRPGARRARTRHRHPGPAAAGRIPLRPHQGRTAPSLDGLRQPRRAACVGEGGLRQGRGAALRAVARRAVARSGDLLHASRGAARQ